MEWLHVLATVLPVLLALVIGFFYNNSRLNDVNSRFDETNRSVNSRFDDVNKRFDDVNKRFDEVHHRIDDLRSDINQRLTAMQGDISEIKNFMMEFLKRESGWVIRDK
ncbi:hypothetical protein H8E88_21420 [candidate division KSB1 bacterium]|nr:hypothetical protein [candidate division KSB1 bacterium]